MNIATVCDIIASILQVILNVWTCNSTASKNNKLSKAKCILLGVLAFLDTEVFTALYTYGNMNPPLANFLMVATTLAIIVFFYRKSIVDGFAGFGMSYMYMTAVSYVLFTIFKVASGSISLKINPTIQLLIFIYIPTFIAYYIFYLLRKYFFSFAIYLKNLKHSLATIQLIDYTLILIATFEGEWATTAMALGLKALLIAVSVTVYVSQAIYFAKINDKSKELEMLNAALNSKIIELRKIKHDYGSEISTIYGLYQMGKYEKMGNVIKGVIERNQATSATIEMNSGDNPMVVSLLNRAAQKGINVVVLDKADYSDLNITENELLRLLSNIINNSIDALSNVENGIIKFNSYNSYEGATFIIENNGPAIPGEISRKIFDTGFSTKSNEKDERGFGLSIVYDIINKCGGSVNVESDDNSTKFKMKIPTKS